MFEKHGPLAESVYHNKFLPYPIIDITSETVRPIKVCSPADAANTFCNSAETSPLSIFGRDSSYKSGGRLEGIREILCLAHDLSVAELYNTHCICWSPLVRDCVFRDPEITVSENSLDVEG
jgi:hypothetical protein